MHRDASATNHYLTEPAAKPIIPSSSSLERQIAAAMAKCDADMEQATLAKETREEARAVRMAVAQAKAINHFRLWTH